MKEKLSKREKKMLCIGGSMVLVSAGLAAYFGVRSYKQNIKNGRQEDMNNILLNDVRTLIDENNFNRSMIIEGGIIPSAIQNLKNKKSRYENKIIKYVEHLSKKSGDKDVEHMLFDTRAELIHVIEQLDKAERLQAKYDADEILYAK